MAKEPGGLAIVLDDGPHDGEHDDGDESDVDHDKAREDAMEEFIDCLHRRDTKGASAAFDAMHELKAAEKDRSEPSMENEEDSNEGEDDDSIDLD